MTENTTETRAESIALLLSIIAGLRYAYRECASWHYHAQLKRIEEIGGGDARNFAEEYAQEFEEDAAEGLFRAFARGAMRAAA